MDCSVHSKIGIRKFENRHSTIGIRKSALDNRHSKIGIRKSAFENRHSAFENPIRTRARLRKSGGRRARQTGLVDEWRRQSR